MGNQTNQTLSKKQVLAVGVIGLGLSFSFMSSTTAQAAIVNGDFSAGFTGWETSGSTDAFTGAAVLTAGATDTASIESFLGLAPGTLAGIGTSPTFGSAIKQSFFANAGTVISFDWLFKAEDYLPYDDFAFYSLVPSGVATLLSNVATVGNYGSSGLQSLSFVIPSTGAYTLGFGVLNSTDNGLFSTLTIDNVVGDVTPVPTPVLLPGLLGMGVAAWRKRKAEAQAEVSEEV